MGSGDPGEERDERPGPRVGPVEVLDDEQDRSALTEPAHDPEHALEQAGLASLGDDGQHPATRRLGRAHPFHELRHEPEEVVGGRTEHTGEVVVGETREDRPERPDQRLVGSIGAGPERNAPQDGHRFLEARDAPDRLVDEAARADAGRAVDEQRAGRTGGG